LHFPSVEILQDRTAAAVWKKAKRLGPVLLPTNISELHQHV
jgi:hypothetical protein